MKKICVFLSVICFTTTAFTENDSLFSVWQNTTLHDTVRLEAYKTYIWDEFMFYDPDSALVLSQDLYKQAKKLNQVSFMGSALNHQAVAYSILAQVEASEQKLIESLKIYLENGYEEKAGASYNNLGSAYFNRGDFKQAAEYYYKALAIFEKFNRTEKLAMVYNNLAVMYNSQKMYELSLEFNLKSLAVKLKMNDDAEIGMGYLNLAALYGDMKKIKKSNQYLDLAFPYLLKSKSYRGLGIYYMNKGHFAFDGGRTDESLRFYHRSRDIFDSISDITYQITSEVHLGGVYARYGEVELAKMYLEDAYLKAKEKQISTSVLEASKLLYELYRDNKEYKLAIEFFEQYHLLKDSLNSVDLQEKTLNLKFEHEYEKKAFEDSVNYAKSQELNLLKLSKQEAQIQKDRTQKYALYGGIGALLIFGAFAFRTYQIKKRDHDIIQLQHEELEGSHFEIQQSIHYAKRLQDVFLPSSETLTQHFSCHFTLFKPKDVVSGDFYWFEYDEASNTKVIAVADCTGHGVPGALVSIVCSNALNKVVKELQILEPAEILNNAREIIIDTFNKKGKEVRDGMDITICSIKNNEVKTAGANNGLWVVEANKGFKEYKADRQPVGWQEVLKPFSQHTLVMQEGDTLYMLTDGFQDQFGGPKNKKFKKATLKELLTRIAAEPHIKQKEVLDYEFEKWRGDQEQVDDVCLIGIGF
jgi:serine phosphatase RsbU (regulator of sigma subunit)